MSWVARGGCVYLWGWGKGADILQKIKEALVKGGMSWGGGVRWGPRQPAGLSIGWKGLG